jgi:hypothetical protein
LTYSITTNVRTNPAVIRFLVPEISPETIALREAIAEGDDEAVFVSRNQRNNLGAEMFARLSIQEEYNVPSASMFSEEFVLN